MKKRCTAVVLVCALLVCLLLPLRNKAYADPFTASQIGSLAYAMMQSWGITFTSGSASASGMNGFMAGQVQDYVNSQGGSIADLFTGRIAVDAAGKLVVAQQMYNSIKTFADWLIDKIGLGDTDTDLSKGDVDGIPIGKEIEGSGEWSGDGIGAWFYDYRSPTKDYPYDGFHSVRAMNGNTIVSSGSCGDGYAFDGTYFISYDQKYNRILVNMPFHWKHSGVKLANPVSVPVLLNVSPDNTLMWNGSDYVEPTVLNPDKEWTGTIGGYSTPDTNLDQLLGGIDQAVADNNLVVDGEVIDVPVPPTPAPEPVAPDTPLQDVPWEGLNDLINTNTESLTNSVDQAADDITQAVDNTTEAVQSLENTITETLQPQEIDEKKFDLKLLFPFCIPFDIHNLLQKFQAEPVAPHVQLPFVIQSIGFSYTFDLDFSAFDSVAAAMRTVEFIVFAIGLAWATSKVIKW